MGSLFVAWFAYKGFHDHAIIRENATTLKQSKINVCNAFKPTIEELAKADCVHLGNTQNILLSDSDNHTKAIDALLWAAEGALHVEFSKAWEKYKGYEEYKKSGAIFSLSEEEKKLMQYIAQSTEQENRDLAVKNIKHILSLVEKT